MIIIMVEDISQAENRFSQSSCFKCQYRPFSEWSHCTKFLVILLCQPCVFSLIPVHLFLIICVERWIHLLLKLEWPHTICALERS